MPSEEALVSAEPGVDTDTRYVCAQSDPLLIDYTSHQYTQVGGNKDVSRCGSDEASYEHPEWYHATGKFEGLFIFFLFFSVCCHRVKCLHMDDGLAF